MENIKGILSRRGSQKNSPQRSRAQSPDQNLKPKINNPPLDIKKTYTANLSKKPEVSREEVTEQIDTSKACNRCNIDHLLGRCFSNVVKDKHFDKSLDEELAKSQEGYPLKENSNKDDFDEIHPYYY